MLKRTIVIANLILVLFKTGVAGTAEAGKAEDPRKTVVVVSTVLKCDEKREIVVIEDSQGSNEHRNFKIMEDMLSSPLYKPTAIKEIEKGYTNEERLPLIFINMMNFRDEEVKHKHTLFQKIDDKYYLSENFYKYPWCLYFVGRVTENDLKNLKDVLDNAYSASGMEKGVNIAEDLTLSLMGSMSANDSKKYADECYERIISNHADLKATIDAYTNTLAEMPKPMIIDDVTQGVTLFQKLLQKLFTKDRYSKLEKIFDEIYLEDGQPESSIMEKQEEILGEFGVTNEGNSDFHQMLINATIRAINIKAKKSKNPAEWAGILLARDSILTIFSLYDFKMIKKFLQEKQKLIKLATNFAPKIATIQAGGMAQDLQSYFHFLKFATS